MGIPSRWAPGGWGRAPHASGRAAGALASLGVVLGALHACTLTSDDFEPALRQRAPLEEAGQEAAARPSTGPDAGLEGSEPAPAEAASASLEPCVEGLACPDGYACAADRCVPSQCAASEDLPSCVGTWCPDGSCAAAQCSDGRLGPGEVDVDCGGPCVRCALGAVCSVDADCAQGGCVGGLCSKPSCADEIRNGDETGTDCGGSCSPCGDGDGCQNGADCRSGVCGACADAGTCCAPASCADGITNGDELATDCGGACGPCPLGAACTAPSSCASNVCLEGSCAALCANGRRDGDESDVDCGGSEVGCPRCEDDRACILNGDCSSGRCDGVCISCADGVANGDELGLDCGSSEPGCVACPRCDAESSVPLGPVGSATPLDAADCAMLARFAGYPPTSIESFDDGPYPVPFTWRQECTGAAGEGVFERQYQQVRLTGLETDCPVFFDLAGEAEPFALRWY